jgi:hypothetical protein
MSLSLNKPKLDHLTTLTADRKSPIHECATGQRRVGG